jgi:phosphatidylserine synthase
MYSNLDNGRYCVEIQLWLVVHLCVYCSSTGQIIDGPSVGLLQEYWTEYWWYICVSIAAVLVRLLMVHLWAYYRSTGQNIDGPSCVCCSSTGQNIDGQSLGVLQEYWTDYWWSICVSIAAVLVRILMVNLWAYYRRSGQNIDGPSVCLLQEYWTEYWWFICVSIAAVPVILLIVHLCI